MCFRIFKENGLCDDERNVSNLKDALTIYREYFEDGYTVRVEEMETGIEYGFWNDKLAPLPYSEARGSSNKRFHTAGK